MLDLLVNFVLLGALALGKEALPATPMDVEVGRQAVELRKALEVQNDGARLVLFVRAAKRLGIGDGNVLENFKAAVPEGSVSALLTGADGKELKLEHTGYTFYRGYKGLILTGAGVPEGGTPQLYSRLELDAKLALPGVRIVWLDRAVLQVWDVYPRL
jgi:hypothetical protein